MTAVEKLVAVVTEEIGYMEKASNSQLDSKTANAGSANYNKYARDLLANKEITPNPYSQGTAWCDMFVDWSFIKAFGVANAKKLLLGWSALTSTSAGYFKNVGRWFTSNPKVGDVIFFKNKKGICHTGIVVLVTSSAVYTVEGNTSSAAGVVVNGGCVRKKSYALNYSNIAGYGRPDYSIVAVEAEEEEMTQEQFNKMADNYINARAEKDPSEWSKDARAWGEKTGIIQGNVDGKMQYKSYCTREQMIVFLKRLFDKMSK